MPSSSYLPVAGLATTICSICPCPTPPITNSIPVGPPGCPVLLVSGQTWFDVPVLSTGGLGTGGFSFILSYLSGFAGTTSSDGTVGINFNYPQNAVLIPSGDDVILQTGQNTQETFVSVGGGNYSSANNNTSAVLSRANAGTSNDQFTLVSRAGVVSHFNGFYSSITTPGRLTDFTDRYGNRQMLVWAIVAGMVRLQSITDSYGRTITFTYNACSPIVTLQSITDFWGRQVNFQYDTLGHLVAVVGPAITRGANNDTNVFPNGTATVYQYDVNNPRPERQNDLIAVYSANQVAAYLDSTRTVDVTAVYSNCTAARQKISYYNDPTDTFQYGRVQQIIESAGGNGTIGAGAYGYLYVESGLPENLIEPGNPIESRTIETDRNGNQTAYDFDAGRILVHKTVFATRSKSSLQAAQWETWMTHNAHNQPLQAATPQGSLIVHEYEDETNTITFPLSGGVPYGRRIGLLKNVTRFPVNSIGGGFPGGNGGSNGQTQLTETYFYDPIFNQQCAGIELRGNPIDAFDDYFTPQNGGTTPSDTDKSRYATINYFDYQKDAAATVEGDTVLQAQLGLTSAQIGDLITFVSGQMSATDGTGGIPAGFEMGIGDVNGEGTGYTTGVDARHQGAVVKVSHPSVRQLIPNGEGAYPRAILSDVPAAYYRLGELSGTVAFDSSGNGDNGTYGGGGGGFTLGQTGAIRDDPDTAVLFNGDGDGAAFVGGDGLTNYYSGRTTLSLECWFNGGGSDPQPFNQFAGWGGFQFIADPTTGNVQLTYSLSDGSNPVIDSGTTLPDSNWHHLAGVFDSAAGVIFYIDGTVVASAAAGQPLWDLPTGESDPLVTNNDDDDGIFSLDEMAIYPNALSPDRVLAHYNAGIGTDPWIWIEQDRIELFTSNARGQGTTETDPEGNLKVIVRYPENDPEGAGQFLVPTLSNQQYGFVKEIHVDADPNRVMSLVGSDGDMIAFIGNKIARSNTPGVYQNLVTSYQSSGTSAGCTSCAYDPLGNPLSTTDPRGNTTTFDRNELGEVYRTTSPPPYNYQTETSFDANRNVTQVDTQDVAVQYASDDPNDPAYAQFSLSGSTGLPQAGNSADLPTKPGPGGSVRPGWFSNLFVFDLLDNKIEEDIDATGSTPSSLVTTFGYDFNQNLIKITKPQGNTIEYDYDERDLQIAIRVGYNPAIGQPGAITVMSYDGNGNLIDVVGPAERGTMAQSVSVVISDAFRSGVALTHVGDWVAENAYDGFDRQITSMDAVGGIVANIFDPGGRIIAAETDGTANGSTPTDRSGSLNVPLAISATNFDEGGRAYEQQQNVFLNTGISGGSPTHPLSSTRSATHTGGGLATNSTTNSNTGTVTLTTGGTSYTLSRTVFDRASRTIATATDNGAITTYAFDGANRQPNVTDPLGNQVQNVFDGNGNVVQSTRVELCTIEDVSTVESFASATFYDCLNRPVVTAMQGPDGSFTPSLAIGSCCSWATLPVSCPGWLTPTGTMFTFFGYDSRGNRTNLIDPKANTTVWQYDGASRQLRTLQHLRTDGTGATAVYDTVTTTNGYDANSRLIRLIDDNGGTSTWNYDTLDRQVVMAFHDGSTRLTTYDLASDKTGYTDENGSSFLDAFDPLGRRATSAISRAASVGGTTAQSFQYDGLSRMTFARDTVTSTNADTAFTFDSIGRMVEEGQTSGSSTKYVTHSTFTSLTATEITYPNNRKVTSGFDDLYRKNAINETSGGASIAAWEFFGGRTATVALGNGVTCSFMNDAGTNSAVQATVPLPAWGDNTTDRLGYDGSGKMIAKRFLPAGGGTTVIVGFTTQYDPSSNKLFERALHAESRSALYPAYDSMDRLLQYQRGVLASGGASVTTSITLPGTDSQRGYNLDGLGNWKNTPYTPVGGSPITEIRQHNKLNEITQFATTPVLYDHGNNTGTSYPNRGNGNITDDGTRLYAYDALNRLITVTRKSDSAVIAAYTYDALGRRILKVVTNGGIPGGIANNTYRYCYDGQQIIEELLVTSGPTYATLRQFVWGQYIDELIQLTTMSPLTADTYYPLQDLLYRTTATTKSTGDIFEAYDYDAYGNTLMFSGAGTGGNWWADDATTTMQPICEYLFTGRQNDPETEIYWYRSRFYGPSLGRFVSRDRNTNDASPNPYEYVLASPVNFIDSNGEDAAPAPSVAEPAIERHLLEETIERLAPLAPAVAVGWFFLWGPGCTTMGHDDYVPGFKPPPPPPPPPPPQPPRRCRPCIPPVGTKGYREDTNPASPPHRGVPIPHWKLYTMNQNPNNCQCFWADVPDNRGGFGKSPPPPGTVPITPAAGGGFE